MRGIHDFCIRIYACESRHDTAQGPSYRRLLTSPKITKIAPSYGLPGTVLTVSGEYLDAGFNLDEKNNISSDSELAHSLEVTLGGTSCSVTAASATQFTCSLEAPSSGASGSSSGVEVLPLRVAADGFGWAGPSLLPLFTVQHQLYNVTPNAGSLGGGQNITITGVNLPTDLARFKVSLTVTANGTNGTQISASSPCTALSSATDGSALVCTTSAMSSDVITSLAGSDDLLKRYAFGQGRNASFNNELTYEASLDVGVKLSMDGDLLRYDIALSYPINTRLAIYYRVIDITSHALYTFLLK